MTRFDSPADRCDAFCATPFGSFVEAVERQMVGELLEPLPGGRGADLGCGTGTYSLWMVDTGCAVVRVDGSEAMFVKARSKRPSTERITWIRADLAHLPCPSGSFDSWLMQVIVEFVDDPNAALRKALRTIKPGGHLVLGLIQGTARWARHYRERAHGNPSAFLDLAELRTVMGMEPARVRQGLFVGPDEFRTAEPAWDLEFQRRGSRSLADAGFLAVRYDNLPAAAGEPDTPS